MKNEEKILRTLDLVVEKLDEHSKRFDAIDARFERIDDRFVQIDARFERIDDRFVQIDTRFEQIDTRFERIEVQLKEHGEHLSALRTGQEYLKAELDGMKIANAKEFGAIKQQMENYNLNFSVLRDEVWNNKVDIERIKQTAGMA